MGGIVCAKQVLCDPPARARAQNEARMSATKLVCDRDLKLAMLEGFGDLTKHIQNYGSLTEKQMLCYHAVAAVLNKDKKTFSAAYDLLVESLIVPPNSELG